jgi:2-polyprenyl-6-methoxyphenol hydroxylase-like FAD-dependent oxidoreductase
MTSIREDAEWTYITYTTSSNENEYQIRSKFLVGADGKTGFTRKQYLEPRRVTLEPISLSGSGGRSKTYNEVWVALNWKISLPTPDTHPDFPLREHGYTSQQVYDAFFPPDFRFLCNPHRAAVCGRFGLASNRLWRLEFVILDNEDGDVMAGTDTIREVVHPYITHRGSRYGIEEDVQYPLDSIQVLRCRPFSFSARSCNEWTQDCVILIGDAAHVFPPFGGQGIASGFRDAISLAWRLAILTVPYPAPHLSYRKMLAGWCTERKQQLDHSLASTLENGSYVCKSNPWRVFVRDWWLWVVQFIPSWKRWFEQGNRREGLTRYEWVDGGDMAFLPGVNGGGGANFPQVYCVGVSEENEEQGVRFTDDVIFDGSKEGLFQLVVFVDEVRDVQGIRSLLAGIDEIPGRVLRTGETTFFVKTTSTPPESGGVPHSDVYRLATAQEFAASPLCVGRPEPRYYEPHRIWKESAGKQFILLRPDRFVFAACEDGDGLRRAVAKLAYLVSEGCVNG